MIFYNSNQEEDSENLAGWKGWTSRIDNFLSTYENKTGKICGENDEAGKDETCLFQVKIV